MWVRVHAANGEKLGNDQIRGAASAGSVGLPEGCGNSSGNGGSVVVVVKPMPKRVTIMKERQTRFGTRFAGIILSPKDGGSMG